MYLQQLFESGVGLEDKRKLIENVLAALPEGPVRNTVRKTLEEKIFKISENKDFVEILKIVIPPVFLPKVLSTINMSKDVTWNPEAKIFLDDLCLSIPSFIRLFIKRKIAKKSIEIAKEETSIVDKRIVLQAALKVLEEAPNRVKNKVEKILAKLGG